MVPEQSRTQGDLPQLRCFDQIQVGVVLLSHLRHRHLPQNLKQVSTRSNTDTTAHLQKSCRYHREITARKCQRCLRSLRNSLFYHSLTSWSLLLNKKTSSSKLIPSSRKIQYYVYSHNSSIVSQSPLFLFTGIVQIFSKFEVWRSRQGDRLGG